jgi:polysaccharide export outer membrane protein
MVYVIGAVRKPGGFLLHERERMSVLQALSLAEGFGETPAPQNSRILRADAGTMGRREINVDLQKVLAGKAENVALQPNDILLVPTSTGKKVGLRAVEAVLQVATGIAIWGR